MCNKSGDTYPPVIQFVPECYKTQEMCAKAFPFVFDSLHNWFKNPRNVW